MEEYIETELYTGSNGVNTYLIKVSSIDGMFVRADTDIGEWVCKILVGGNSYTVSKEIYNYLRNKIKLVRDEDLKKEKENK